MREEERRIEEHLVNKIKNNPKMFHNSIRDQLYVKELLLWVLADDDVEILEKEEIYEVMNDGFHLMSTYEDTEPPEMDGNPTR